MAFKAAAGSTVGLTDEKMGFQIVIEVTCPKCGVNVGRGCLITLNAKQEVRQGSHVDGYGFVTPCCYMLVAADHDFSRWAAYQYVSHKCNSDVTNPFTEKGMMCDVSKGVETVDPITRKTEADHNPLSGNIGP